MPFVLWAIKALAKARGDVGMLVADSPRASLIIPPFDD